MFWFNCPKCGRDIKDPADIFTTSCISMCYSCFKDHNKIVSIDLDGVLAEYTGWKGDNFVGKPLPGMIDLIKQLKNEGFSVIISTARGILTPVYNWISEHGIDDCIEMVTNKKPAAHIYIDDRAFCFDPSIEKDKLIEIIKTFKPHWSE